MSNSVIKSYYTSGQEKKEKRVIDSNQAVSERIRALSEILESVPEEDFAEEFSEGLDAEQVDALLTDQDELAEEAARNEAARARQLEQEAMEKSAALDAEYEAKMSELEPKMVEALTDIYSHVFGIDLSGRNDVVLHLLKDTIRNIESSKNFLVHVSKEDREYVSENRDVLTEGLGGSATVEVIEDITLSAGNCFIETDGGIFDCSLGTELELLRKELRILSYTE